MVALGSQWPPLSGGRENSARNINERILDANYDVIVKLGDSDSVKRFRTQTPAEITKIAEKARVKAAKEGDKAEITQISWLVLPEGKKSGSLIVEFTLPHTTNNIIDTGAL
ncbi:hypothetical protein PENFLA_c019G00440 [Penicillium flavigenum]|uniref:Uncharacterized protein n=1 Tax=Penicillium flavigenum TaxID=254877 RepID=A0A1V6SYS9_9EURO|nr:hypothetical protein PENFLA_c019G00440 [Penicillium flavigenum]